MARMSHPYLDSLKSRLRRGPRCWYWHCDDGYWDDYSSIAAIRWLVKNYIAVRLLQDRGPAGRTGKWTLTEYRRERNLLAREAMVLVKEMKKERAPSLPEGPVSQQDTY